MQIKGELNENETENSYKISKWIFNFGVVGGRLGEGDKNDEGISRSIIERSELILTNCKSLINRKPLEIDESWKDLIDGWLPYREITQLFNTYLNAN